MAETDNPFEKVLDRLREKGWHKGSFGHESGPNCIVGAGLLSEAITADATGYWGSSPVVHLLVGVIAEHYNQTGGVAHFNDHPDTTFEDVERVLEKAAVKWEEERVMRND